MAFAIVGMLGAACSALVGVEDVHLAISRDTGVDDSPFSADTAPVPDGGYIVVEAGVEVAAGFLHTCARKDGRIKCWGGNINSQLGAGDSGPSTESKTPIDVLGITDAISLSSGNSHSCVVRRGGKVSCWGYNLFGQLGNATTNEAPFPVDAIGIDNAVAVSCGSTFTCALLTTGKVSCWGDNSNGALGDGTTIDRTTPALVLELDDAVAITTAMQHACAVLKSGGVKCWGTNTDGQLGNGTTTKSYVPVAASASGALQVIAASQFTCARDASGQVTCWGSNFLGELGTGATNPAPNPSPAISSVHDAIDLAAGYQHACAARRNGEVQCWGAAGEGQVGTGSITLSDAAIPRPTTVVGVSGALGVSAGGDHSCAVDSRGGVFCWGDNSFGELGNGTEDTAYAAVPVAGYP